MIRLIILFLFFLLSCNGKNDVPGHVLPPAQMRELMWDIMLADELNLHQRQSDTALDLDRNRVILYESVFSKHGVTRENFSGSLQYYQNRPDMLKIILDSLHKRAETPQNAPRQRLQDTAVLLNE